MNVKQGDLAIQTRSLCGNEGKICKIIKYLGYVEFLDGSHSDTTWQVEYPSPVKNLLGWSLTLGIVPDQHLRPISGLPDTDEVEDEKPIKEIA